ncbi:unnamed protein product [Rhizophagus irregularis]|uniref:Protein kinase domain-containing protein n=2 Tax=Rhizophagus irregularis TaxID=588596 RepID=A0A916EGX9_9GLOM|nr:unnamed protein product [Rhizophagus irregularis]CAB5386606.1 unnamed protein product [Rhizophagus irregularis]
MVDSGKWIDDVVKTHYISLIPFEEFVVNNFESDDNNKISYWKETGKRVLFKIINDNISIDNKMEKSFLLELKLHQRRDFNERIIQIFGVSQNPTTNSCFLVVQYADGGNLRHILENTILSWVDKLNLAHQIAEGLNFLHSNGIIHENLILNHPDEFEISEQDKEFRELEIDAMTAELWLVKKDIIIPTEIKTKKDNNNNNKETVLESPIEIEKDEKEEKEKEKEKVEKERIREVKLITNEPELGKKLSIKKKSWTYKAKNKAKGFVKRLSGSTSGSDLNTSNIKKSFTKSMSFDSKEVIDQGERIDTGWTFVSSDIKEPESPIMTKSDSSINRGLFSFSNLTGRSASESSISKSISVTQPDKYSYSEYCKVLFATNSWTINSAPCYAAYHAKKGDLDGLKWHIHVQKEKLNEIQQITGPRNSYRRPLEPLMIEVAQYCPGENIIQTFTSLISMGATCDCTNSYTGGSPINYLGENKSLFSSETNSQYFKDSLTYLITNGCLINAKRSNGDTLLITLLFKWNKELTPNVIKFCLDNGANPNLSNEIGGNPLGYTLTQIRFNHRGGPFEKIYKILKLLVRYGADVNRQITIPGKKLPNLLFVCVDMGLNMKEEWVKKLIKRLIKWGVDVNARMGEQKKFDEEINNNNYDNDNDDGDNDDGDIIKLAGTSKDETTTPKVTFNLTEEQKEKELLTKVESLNILGYAAKLSQLSTIKILLDRIYSISSPESIKEALNVTSKGEVEQKKFFMSWLNESGKEKRDKVKAKMERREMRRREKLKKKVKKGKQTENYDDDDDDDDYDYDDDDDDDDDDDEE